jgi:hypothetical protein
MKLVEKSEKGQKQSASEDQAVQSGEAMDTQATPARPELIKKSPVKANLEDYESAYGSFSWEEAKKEISYFPDGKVNAAYNAIDRHINNGRRNKVALYTVGADNKLEKLTFQEIYEESNRIGNALKSLGVKKGDRVFALYINNCHCKNRRDRWASFLGVRSRCAERQTDRQPGEGDHHQ